MRAHAVRRRTAQALSRCFRARIAQDSPRPPSEMSQRELLALVIGELNRLGIPYMLTGSLASSMQGVPRSTHDIDLVVALASEQIDALVAAFGEPDYYLSREAIQDAP